MLGLLSPLSPRFSGVLPILSFAVPMAHILAISSQVAYGTVGLSVIVPALQALGHEVIGLPTVLLSNHPGHLHSSGTRVDPMTLAAMVDALDANGWLSSIDGVLTGYLPSAEHVAFAASAVERVLKRSRAVRPVHLCDPVLGDDPKGLYIDPAAAVAIRDRLVPGADLVTPNRFELSYLSGHDVRSAVDVARVRLPCAGTYATSIPVLEGREIANVAVVQDGQTGANLAFETRVALRSEAPHGTGDLFSALLLAARLERRSPADALAFATAGVDLALARSADPDAISLQALPRADARLAWAVEQREWIGVEGPA